jgi:hypothetical protein
MEIVKLFIKLLINKKFLLLSILSFSTKAGCIRRNIVIPNVILCVTFQPIPHLVNVRKM